MFKFNAFGAPTERRTIAQVFAGFTKELKEIKQENEEEAARLAEEIKAKQAALSVAEDEATKATAAIANFGQLLGLPHD